MHPSPLTTHPSPPAAEALRIARECFATGPTWVALFRETLGKDGCCVRLFPNYDDMRAFRQTAQWREIIEMLSALREAREVRPSAPTQRMITVRLPSDLHDALKRRAAEDAQSLNRFCVSALFGAVTDPASPA